MLHHSCRRRDAGGVSAPQKVLIWWKFLKNPWEIWANLYKPSQNPWKSEQTPENISKLLFVLQHIRLCYDTRFTTWLRKCSRKFSMSCAAVISARQLERVLYSTRGLCAVSSLHQPDLKQGKYATTWSAAPSRAHSFANKRDGTRHGDQSADLRSWHARLEMSVRFSLHCQQAQTYPVAYAENFHGGVWFKVIWWLFVFGVHCLWRHNLTSFHVSKPTFWRSLLT